MAMDLSSWLAGAGLSPVYGEDQNIASWRTMEGDRVTNAAVNDPQGRWQMGYSAATTTDPSGRPIYGTEFYDPYNNANNAPPNGLYRIGDGFDQWRTDPRLTDILRQTGGGLDYSDQWGYTIPGAALQKWKQQYSPDPWYEKGLGPWGLGLAAFGGAAASGIAAGAGTGIEAGAGAGTVGGSGAVSPWYDNTLASLGGSTDVGAATLGPTAGGTGGNVGFLSDLTDYFAAPAAGTGYSMAPLYGGTDLGTMISQQLAGMAGTAAPEISTGVLSGAVGTPGGLLTGGGSDIFGGIGDWLSRLGTDLKLDTPKGQLSAAGNLLSVIRGLGAKGNVTDASLAGAAIADPFGLQRQFYQQQLQQLFSDPSKLQQYPGYKAGLQAVERRGAAQGWNGSGNMMTSLQDYGQNFFKDTVAQLAGLAGANIGPGNAGLLLQNGALLANQADANALARLGLMLPRGT